MIVANALQAMLSPEEQDRLASVPTENLAAYEAYLLGKQQLAKANTTAIAKATDYFKRAVALDPDFALAHVGLADSYVWQSLYDHSWEEMLDKAQAAAERALELDRGLGEAYNSLAGIQYERNDLEGAEATFQRALELNPNYATAYEWYGDLLSHDRPEEALAQYQRALELDPLSATTIDGVGSVLFQLRRFDEAMVRFEKALEVEPDYARAYRGIGRYYHLVKGQLDDALLAYTKGATLDPGDSDFPTELAALFLDLGDPDRAEYWMERSLELPPAYCMERSLELPSAPFRPNFVTQLLHLYRNDESALEFARKYAEGPIGTGPILSLLRDHEFRAERYAEIRARYEKHHPELLNEDDPKVDNTLRRHWRSAIDIALVLSKTGEQERADLLLERSLQHIQTRPRHGTSLIAEADVFALQGHKKKALSNIRKAIDDGWRDGWWYFLLRDPALDSLRDEPEFQEMVAEIEADMAAQLARVREMERNGELEPIPEISATTQ